MVRQVRQVLLASSNGNFQKNPNEIKRSLGWPEVGANPHVSCHQVSCPRRSIGVFRQHCASAGPNGRFPARQRVGRLFVVFCAIFTRTCCPLGHFRPCLGPVCAPLPKAKKMAASRARRPVTRFRGHFYLVPTPTIGGFHTLVLAFCTHFGEHTPPRKRAQVIKKQNATSVWALSAGDIAHLCA